MKKLISKIKNRVRRHKRVRAKIFGTMDCPRLSFFKSNKQIYAQLIDDETEKTLVGVSSLKLSEKSGTDKAKKLGEEIAKLAKDKKISKVVFDRGGFLYTGTVKTFADSARDNGLKF